MLAAIISLLQDDIQPQPTPSQIVKIDLGGGGGPGSPSYDIVDYIEALSTFREIDGEDGLARAVRRKSHVLEHLGRRQREQEAKERELAQAFLAGATVAHEVAAIDARKVQLVTLDMLERATAEIDRLREVARAAQHTAAHARRPASRGGAILLFALGIGTGIALSRRRT